MSHQVLARKWRPQNFADMVGQQHVLQALGNALEQQRLHHAYLLTGTRGVGKTTIARILARCLNCEQGITRTPCGTCGSCVEISEGRSIDMLEVDAASRTKVEDTRELLENVQFAPTSARYKVYLIDEVHMLSNSSFNALLKTLEEPPPHVVFVLATTHPQKIPPTVLSRCLQFHLKNLSEPVIAAHLARICESESIKADDAALALLARAAAGSMRDALTLLEQASSFGDGNLDARQVGEMLGVIDAEVLTGICEAIVSGDAATALDIVASFMAMASDATVLVDEMLTLFHRAAVEQVVEGAGSEAQVHAEVIRRFAATLAPEELQLFYQAALTGKRDLSLAPDPRSGLEMLVLRMFAFRPLGAAAGSAVESSAVKSSAVESSAVQSSAAKPAAAAAKSAPGKSEKKKPAPVADRAASQVQATRPEAQARKSEAQPQAPAAETTEPEQSVSAVSEQAGLPLDPPAWAQLFAKLPLEGMVRAVAANMVPVAEGSSNQRQVFALLSGNALLYKPAHAERVAAGLSLVFEQPVEVEVRMVESWQEAGMPDAVETPALRRERLQEERQQKAIESLREDAGAQALIDAFDASIDFDSVEPVGTAAVDALTGAGQGAGVVQRKGRAAGESE